MNHVAGGRGGYGGEVDAFKKRRADAPPGFFEAEAAGLRWLAAAREADAEATRVVAVRGLGPGWIELERLRESRPTREAARDFGAALARTHSAGATAFGAAPDGWEGPCFIGRQELSTRPEPRWSTFYADQRVMPYLRRAVDRGHVTTDEAAIVERACGMLRRVRRRRGSRALARRLSGTATSRGLLTVWCSSTQPRMAVIARPTWRCSTSSGSRFLDVVLGGYDETRPAPHRVARPHPGASAPPPRGARRIPSAGPMRHRSSRRRKARSLWSESRHPVLFRVLTDFGYDLC